jgi:hypothetical protein
MRLAVAVLVSLCGLTAQELIIVEPAVADFPGGLGVPDTKEFEAGQRVYVSFTVGGFRSVAETGNIFLEFLIEPVDSLGVAFDKPFEGRLITTTRRAESRPIRFDFVIPQAPLPGEGRFRITVHDRVGNQEARTEAPFLVASSLPPQTGGFEVTGFRFFSSEYSEEPIVDPKFRPGETALGRFYLSGFSVAENNRYRLSYGVSLRNKAGRVIFTEQQAVAESRESFYPKTHVPGMISVRLESTIRPGDYLVEIAAADEAGNRKTTSTFPLRVVP